MTRLRQFLGPLLALFLTLTFGVAGYVLIEHWSLLDALFMTVITVTTVGYREVHPLSTLGQIITIVLIFVGVGAVLYSLTSLFEWILAIDWREQRRRRHMEESLAHLEHHFIACGYGRVGKSGGRGPAARAHPNCRRRRQPGGTVRCRKRWLSRRPRERRQRRGSPTRRDRPGARTDRGSRFRRRQRLRGPVRARAPTGSADRRAG